MPFSLWLEGGKISLCGEYTALSYNSFQLPVAFILSDFFFKYYIKKGSLR